MIYYFAYGSNMASLQMRSRCPDSQKLGPARLQGYRWMITTRGYANIVVFAGEFVEGILYAITAADETALDRFEGVASGCYQKARVTLQYQGQVVEALVYIDPIETEGAPQDEYIDRINTAVADASLSASYINRVIRRFIPQKG